MTKLKRDTNSGEIPKTASSAPPTSSRHMYTNEEYRFVLYHKEVLKLGSKELHEVFHSYFAPEASVSVDSLTQLASRLKKTRPDDVVSVVHTEPWAQKAPPAEVEGTGFTYKADVSSTVNYHLDDSKINNSKSPKISLRVPPKHSRHSYTNEQQRFIYFYRNDLQMNLYQTYQYFNEYFNLDLGRSALSQLSGRLKKSVPADIVGHMHTEPWAIGCPGEYR